MLVLQDAGGHTPWSQGAAGFISAPHGNHRYFIGVRCQLGSQLNEEIAQLDTAAEWSVIGPDVAEELEDDLGDELGHIQMRTSRGLIVGPLRRLRIALLADEGMGNNVDVEATVLVAADWAGPVMLGFKGFLERLRIGIDPGASAVDEPRVYFGSYTD